MRPVPIFGRSKSETRISTVEHMTHGGGDMRRIYDQARTDIRARANAKKWQFLIDNLKKAVGKGLFIFNQAIKNFPRPNLRDL